METVAKYAYQVYQKGSFTKAAKSLYLSQPSLSAAIAKLEEELGFPIFDRSTIPCSLTAEGRIYMESLEEIMECESRMKRKVEALGNAEQASITVGGASYASYLVLSDVCEKLYQQYPTAKVTLDIGNAANLHGLGEKLEKGEIDLLVTYKFSDKRFAVEPIAEERLFIAMRRDMEGAEALRHLALTWDEVLTGNYAPEREMADLSPFLAFPFLEFAPNSDTGQRLMRMLGEYTPSPCKIANARHSEMHYNLMCAGVGAALTTTFTLRQKPKNEDILFFMPKSEESHRRILLAYRHSSESNPLVRAFVSLAKKSFR